MNETLNEYDDLLDDADHPWRKRLIGLLALAALVAVAAYALWATVLGGGGSSAAEIQTATVERGSISQTLSTTGVAVAQSTADMSFDQSGTVSAVNATLGQEVKQGDVLAEIESDELESALTTAEVNLASAQAKLDDLLKGATASDLASADQSVIQAQANLDQTEDALEDLLDEASESELRAAEQAVASAESQLAKAEELRSNLYSASDDAVTAAEKAVAKAEDALANAKRTADSAADSLVSAKASLQRAAATYCDTEDHIQDICPQFAKGSFTPLNKSQIDDLNDSITELITAAGAVSDYVQAAQAEPSPTPDTETETETETATATETETETDTSSQTETGADLITASTALLSANTSYKNALASKTSADHAVESAEADIETAKNDLAEAKQGPSSAEIAAADVEVAAAQLALDQANEQLAELKAGPTQDDLDDAQKSIDSATAGLVVAQAKLDDVYAGADPLDIDLQQEQVRQAELAVEKAKENLGDTQLIAPFDGTVAELNIEVGDDVGGGGTDAAIVLSTPDAVYLNLTITESDITGLEVGQSGIATFDAIESQAFPITIESIGTNPTTTQGVVTYQAQASVQTGPLAGAAGASSSGVPTESAAPTSTPVADTSAKPLPGMNASVTIIVDQAQGVLVVPESAVQTEGRNSVVEVLKDDGSTEKVVVQTGLSDGSNIEITQGLKEGQTVIIPTRAATTSAQSTQTAGTQQGAMPEGGMPPGGPTEGGAP